MNGKLAIAIIWHMHQPYYKHPQTSEFVLPWVRLHASKDYLHMARLLNEFPKVKVNFTMVPSLRDQRAARTTRTRGSRCAPSRARSRPRSATTCSRGSSRSITAT